MAVRTVVLEPSGTPDPPAEAVRRAAAGLGLGPLRGVRRSDVIHLDGDLTDGQLDHLVEELLAHPLLVAATISAETSGAAGTAAGHAVEVAPRPGVHDQTAAELVRAARRLDLPVRRAATARRWVIDAGADVRRAVIDRVIVNPVVERHGPAPLPPAWPEADAGPGPITVVAVRHLDDDGLAALDARRRLALDPDERRAVREHFRSIGRDPTDAELETLAQTWSEHCCHKTFRAVVDHGGEVIDGLLSTFLRRATETLARPWVRSAFVDDAGVVAFTPEREVAVKVETHNHPSAIEPFGGANTGVGGVLRDVLGVGARPVALTDVLCFGPDDAEPPPGVLHPRRVRDGVVAGVGDYGNKVGVPTVAGAVLHHPGYTTTPLVFCGCVGVRPTGTAFPGPAPGDVVVVLGGATGRDGVGGATFSSQAMAATTAEVAGSSVQIGAPITEKGVADVVVEAVAAGLVRGLTDCGAGGLSSAVGELADGVGAHVRLDDVRRKYAGLAPWEVWLSEAQERMVLAVEPAAVERLRRLAGVHEVGLDVVGAFTGDGRIRVTDAGRSVVDLDLDLLHRGRPRRRMTAEPVVVDRPARRPWPDLDATAALLRVLAHPDVRSVEPVVRTYDHEVRGRTAVRPLVGPGADGPADGTVIALGDGGADRSGLAVGIGVHSTLGTLDPERMAHAVVDEAIRNVVAAGADPDRVALLDNFAWGDPTDPPTLGALVAACRGCHDAAVAHGAPFVSGKDSLNNTWVDDAGGADPVPPTLVITAVGPVPDVTAAVSSDPSAPGLRLYLVGGGAVALGGSHLDLALGEDRGGAVAPPDPGAPDRNRALHRALRAGLVDAVHDLSDGGLTVAAAEMAVGAGLGARLDLLTADEASLFGEGNGRYLVAVSDRAGPTFEAHLPGAARVGVTTDAGRLVVRAQGRTVIDVALDALRRARAGEVA